MCSKKLKFSLSLAVLAALVPVTAPVTAMDQVFVYPSITSLDCVGIYSEGCGWAPFEGAGGGGGGGGGGYAPAPGIYDDGTRGTPSVNRYSPGCPREAQYMNEVQSFGHVGAPPGIVIVEKPGDRFYNNGQWVKMQADRIYHSTKTPSEIGTRWRTTIHYMYNVETNQVEQLKLKTSFELGCIGTPFQVGAGAG